MSSIQFQFKRLCNVEQGYLGNGENSLSTVMKVKLNPSWYYYVNLRTRISHPLCAPNMLLPLRNTLCPLRETGLRTLRDSPHEVKFLYC